MVPSRNFTVRPVLVAAALGAAANEAASDGAGIIALRAGGDKLSAPQRKLNSRRSSTCIFHLRNAISNNYRHCPIWQPHRPVMADFGEEAVTR